MKRAITFFTPLLRSFSTQISSSCLRESLQEKLFNYPIYLDYQATTPLDPRVLDKMMPFLLEKFGNPHSKTHKYGEEANEFVEEARKEIGRLIGANEKEIYFTSGATESNNLAIKGACLFKNREDKAKNHIITVQTEHKCVLETCRHLSLHGFEITYLPVKTNGIIDLNLLKSSIKPSTILVSTMTVNNEIGVIQPIQEIGKLCHSKGVLFHTDAAQALGKVPLNVDEMNIDLMSMSGHKIYGPKGIGAIYVRRKPRVKLDPIISGGGQEKGYRSGTLPAPLIIGFGEACRLAKLDMANDHKHISELHNILKNGLLEKLTHITINGDPIQRYPGNLNVSFLGVEGEGFLMRAKTLAMSSGSACTSDSLEPSYVLRALGLGDETAHTSIRIGIGRFSTKEEIHHAVDSIVKHVNDLRDISPIWEMIQEGIDLNTVKWDV